MKSQRRPAFAPLIALVSLLAGQQALAQAPGAGGPPAVGVVKVASRPITETSEFVGRIQAVQHVDLVARVTAFIEERLFTEGAEVSKGDLLYRLERAPFEADLLAKQSQVAQQAALLTNANITLQRAQTLLNTVAGQRSIFDDATAQQRSIAAQLQNAQAQVRTSQINLDYTEIRAPVDGKITRSNITVGNVVGPTTGPLATIVSQDPMWVTFPVPVRTVVELAKRYEDRGGMAGVVIKLVLPDGSTYAPEGKIDYVAPSVAQSTDTLIVRGTIANKVRPGVKAGDPGDRPLYDNEFVTVQLQGVAPVNLVAVPRAAVLSDQAGTYVFVVDAENKAQRRAISMGQTAGTLVAITTGLKEGETVVVDGLQRVRPGAPVSPGPAAGGPPGAPGGPPAGAKG